MATFEEVKADTDYEISLTKLTGQVIKDIHGYVTKEYGDYLFKITQIVFEDGTTVGVDGEQDLAYISPTDTQSKHLHLDDEVLESLCS